MKKSAIMLHKIRCDISEIRAILRDFINTPNLKKTFIYGIVLYAIALFALIRGDIYYIDDNWSSIGNATWNNASRYLATFILNGVATLGKGSIDFSPLSQIIAVCFVVASAMILIYVIRGRFDLLGIVASLPLGLSPHFLQNLSFKFDSLAMAMALFFAILPFLFKDKLRIFCAVSVVSLLCMLMLYQAANGTYIILSLYFAFLAFFIKRRGFKDSAIFLGVCALNLIIASLLYGIINDDNMHLINSNAKVLSLDSRFIVGVFGNLATYLNAIFDAFKQTPYIYLIALNFALFVANVAICANRPKIYAIFGAMIFLLLGICLSCGLYLILDFPIFYARAFYGFNAFIAVIAVANISFILDLVNLDSAKSIALPRLQKITHYISYIVAVIMAYFLISFANIYGNALTKQDKYLDFRAEMLLNNLDSAILNNANNMFSFKINMGNHAVAQRFIDKYGDIATQLLIAKEFVFTAKLRHYNRAFRMEPDICDYVKEQLRDSITIITNNHYNKIEKVKNCYIVTIH